MLDFLFITSPTNARNPHPPYYFMYLAAYLRQKGLKVKIIDPKGGDRPNDLQRHMSAIRTALELHAARFVGLAAFHSDFLTVFSVGEMVKRAQPHCTLLVGNAHATINPEDFIYQGSPFDIAILGEGEETCWELANEDSFLDRFEIPGLMMLEPRIYANSKKVEHYALPFRTPPRHLMDLKDLPMPAYDLVDMDFYLRPQKLIIRRIYTSMVCIFAGRGCPYAGNCCDFCAANVVWRANKGKTARLRPVDNVLDEINYLRDLHKVDFVYMFDDMFGMSRKWMDEWFVKKVEEDNRVGQVLPYACQTRANIATEEMIRSLKESGCIQVDIGVESGSQEILNRVNKKITVQQVQNVISWCSKYRIRSFATMLLNLPGEKQEDLRKTYDLLESHRPSAGVIFGVTTPYPGTRMYEECCHPKLSKDDYSLLINNRLNPIERFRMSEHRVDLEKLWDRWNRHFLATPMFERMWCLRPFQPLYWKAVWGSVRRKAYVKCWLKDLPKTFVLWWLHKMRIYRFAKRIQYGRDQ